MSTTYTGSGLYLKFGSTELAADYRSFTPSFSIGLEDASAGSDTGMSRLTTLKDGSASLTMRAPVGGTATSAALEEGTEGTLEWGPEGTATNKPKRSVNCFVESFEETLAYAGVTEWSVTFQQSDTSGVSKSNY